MTPPSTSVARTVPINTSVPLSIPVGTVTSVNLHNASGHLNLTDYVEARGRAGYVVGNLLWYGFIGMVMGRASYSVSATTDVTCIIVANTLITGTVLPQRFPPGKAMRCFGATPSAPDWIGCYAEHLRPRRI
jgi:hypothetical protein